MTIATATISSQGQATIPSSVRKLLGLKKGERVLFRRAKTNGQIILERASSMDESTVYFTDLAKKSGVKPIENLNEWFEGNYHG